MNEERQLRILLAPHLSEKSAMGEAYRQYVFFVARNATKPEVRQAVEAMFNVAVEAVRVVNTKGKRTVFKRIAGRRQGTRKAYVTLKEGHTIDMGGKP